MCPVGAVLMKLYSLRFTKVVTLQIHLDPDYDRTINNTGPTHSWVELLSQSSSHGPLNSVSADTETHGSVTVNWRKRNDSL